MSSSSSILSRIFVNGERSQRLKIFPERLLKLNIGNGCIVASSKKHAEKAKNAFLQNLVNLWLKKSPYPNPWRICQQHLHYKQRLVHACQTHSQGCLRRAGLGGRSPCSTGCLMRNSAACWPWWTEAAGVPAPRYSWTDGVAELGMAAGAGMLQGRWLLNNTSASSNFLSAVKVSGSWSCGLLKTAAGLT